MNWGCLVVLAESAFDIFQIFVPLKQFYLYLSVDAFSYLSLDLLIIFYVYLLLYSLVNNEKIDIRNYVINKNIISEQFVNKDELINVVDRDFLYLTSLFHKNKYLWYATAPEQRDVDFRIRSAFNMRFCCTRSDGRENTSFTFDLVFIRRRTVLLQALP